MHTHTQCCTHYTHLEREHAAFHTYICACLNVFVNTHLCMYVHTHMHTHTQCCTHYTHLERGHAAFHMAAAEALQRRVLRVTPEYERQCQFLLHHVNTLPHTATRCNAVYCESHLNMSPNVSLYCIMRTYCNTQQPTATHCNTLPNTATSCNTLQRRTTSQT